MLGLQMRLQVLGEAGVVAFAPTEPLKLHAGYARVFRGVVPHELQPIGELSTPLTNANDIDPEAADKLEAGVAYDNGKVFASAAPPPDSTVT